MPAVYTCDRCGSDKDINIFERPGLRTTVWRGNVYLCSSCSKEFDKRLDAFLAGGFSSRRDDIK